MYVLVQDFSGLVLDRLHLKRFLIGARRGLFTKHMLIGPKRVDGDGGMHIVGRADGNGLHLFVKEDFPVIRDGLAAAVLFHSGNGAVGQNVAEVLDLGLWILQISGDVGRIGDGTATDDADFHMILPFLCICTRITRNIPFSCPCVQPLNEAPRP